MNDANHTSYKATGKLPRLALARKIAAITLFVWKKGARLEAEHLIRDLNRELLP